MFLSALEELPMLRSAESRAGPLDNMQPCRRVLTAAGWRNAHVDPQRFTITARHFRFAREGTHATLDRRAAHPVSRHRPHRTPDRRPVCRLGGRREARKPRSDESRHRCGCASAGPAAGRARRGARGHRVRSERPTRRGAALPRTGDGTAREPSRLQYVDPRGRVLGQVDSIPTAGAVTPLEKALEARLDQFGAAGTLVFTHLGDDPTQITAVVPVMRQQRYHGALVARIDGGDLLIRGIAPEIIERYRLALTVDDQVMATTAASFADGVPAHYATTISPLPANMHLRAAGYATDAPLAENVSIWGFAGLALTVVVALASLATYMARQGRIDSALLAEASLRRAMEDSLATGLRVLDMTGAIRYVNRAFCRMSGWTPQELVGRRPPFPDWAPEDVAANMVGFEAMLAGGEPPAGTEIVVQRPDGSRFDARMYSSPLVDASGQQIGWMTSVADVT